MQQALNLDATTEGSRTLPTSVEAALYCDAEVAPTKDRVFAASVDIVISLAGFAAFMAVVSFMTGGLQLDAKALPFYGASLFLLTLLYRLVCCIGGIDTLGIQLAGLTVLSFNGRRPAPRARIFRLAGGVVSFLSMGIGLVWSLLDEERLTWHDHMSRTFPTRRLEY